MAEKMVVEPSGTKRKSEMETEGDAASPTRRPGSGLTLESITALLANQTREIQDSTSKQINVALQALEDKTLKRMEATEEKVVTAVKAQDIKIAELGTRTEALLERVKLLESKPSGGSAGSTEEGGERLALVMGGWKRDTHRDHILQDFAAMGKDLDLGEFLDGEHFVPGIRSSVVIVPFLVRAAETETSTRNRMSKVLQLVREAKMQTQHLPENATIWAAVSRPRAVRKMAAHAGKVRRCLYLLDINAKNSECEYSSGSVWLGGNLLASASRARPTRDNILDGIVAGGWLDAQAVAHAVPCALKRVEEAWKQCLEG